MCVVISKKSHKMYLDGRLKPMKKIESAICKNRIKILILTLILIIPAIIGTLTTKINYDILIYLPEDIETIEGQKILTEDFDMGAFL